MCPVGGWQGVSKGLGALAREGERRYKWPPQPERGLGCSDMVPGAPDGHGCWTRGQGVWLVPTVQLVWALGFCCTLGYVSSAEPLGRWHVVMGSRQVSPREGG